MKNTLLVLFSLLNLTSSVQAKDNGQWEDTSPSIKEWYRNLMQPDNPRISCCGEADAYWTDAIEVVDGKTYAIVTDTRDDGPLSRPHIDSGTRVFVPDHKLKWDKGNPTGHTVSFINTDKNVICFVQGWGI